MVDSRPMRWLGRDSPYFCAAPARCLPPPEARRTVASQQPFRLLTRVAGERPRGEKAKRKDRRWRSFVLALRAGLDSRLRAWSRIGSDSPPGCHSLPIRSSPIFCIDKVIEGTLCAPSMTLAPRAGLEPATLRLTAGCSTIELSRNVLYFFIGDGGI